MGRPELSARRGATVSGVTERSVSHDGGNGAIDCNSSHDVVSSRRRYKCCLVCQSQFVWGVLSSALGAGPPSPEYPGSPKTQRHARETPARRSCKYSWLRRNKRCRRCRWPRYSAARWRWSKDSMTAEWEVFGPRSHQVLRHYCDRGNRKWNGEEVTPSAVITVTLTGPEPVIRFCWDRGGKLR